MKKIGLLILALFILTQGNGQFYKKHENDKLSFYGTIDIRNSVVLEENLTFYGLKLGFGNKRVRFGLGYHILQKNIFRFFGEENSFDPVNLDNKNYSYRHASIYIDPVLYQTQRWELLFPIHLGIGPLQAFQFDSTGTERQILSRDFVPSFTVSIKANYRVFKWVGFTGGFGNNFVFLDNSQFGKEFNTVFYSFGLKLFFDEFGKFAKNKEYRKKYLFKFDFIDD